MMYRGGSLAARSLLLLGHLVATVSTFLLLLVPLSNDDLLMVWAGAVSGHHLLATCELLLLKQLLVVQVLAIVILWGHLHLLVVILEVVLRAFGQVVVHLIHVHAGVDVLVHILLAWIVVVACRGTLISVRPLGRQHLLLVVRH